MSDSKLAFRLERDNGNALLSKQLALAKLNEPIAFKPVATMGGGVPQSQSAALSGLRQSKASMKVIVDHPFDAMIEAEVETTTGSTRVLWYANERTETNEFLRDGAHMIQIVSWTHPAVQVALSSDLLKKAAIKSSSFSLRSVKPLARARFSRVLPSLVGLYEPGGSTREKLSQQPDRPSQGLKAVKLAMTREQVDAFISQMDGYLLISGAPGTGKTTVALQRIRFLLDQQDEREPQQFSVRYSPESTRVFLGNKNLIAHTRSLLTTELGVPGDVVSLVASFVTDYVEANWRSKRGARLRIRQLTHEESRAREAMFNLCKVRDLSRLWSAYESQIVSRLGQAGEQDWIASATETTQNAHDSFLRLLEALRKPCDRHPDPTQSTLRMDSLYSRTHREYDSYRSALSERDRNEFDAAFARWISWVYDPLDSIAAYFREHEVEAKARIKNGTGDLLDPNAVILSVYADWGIGPEGSASTSSTDDDEHHVRQYGPEELSWIAWLLRHALPEEETRFRETARAYPAGERGRWTHVVIDEAQDLAVQEASLLASFVHPRGSLTVSADFRQVVSPVHGMETPEALSFGSPVSAMVSHERYPFRKNMRQGREIGRFLHDFYQAAFQEFPPFDPSDDNEGSKPILITGPSAYYPRQIRQLMSVFERSSAVQTVALIQVNESLLELQQLRADLQREGVVIAADGVLVGAKNELTITSAEHAKGLEFDACIVIGLDDVERASLNFSKNRAYVALSRATRRLVMLSEQFPSLLGRIPPQTFDHRTIREP